MHTDYTLLENSLYRAAAVVAILAFTVALARFMQRLMDRLEKSLVLDTEKNTGISATHYRFLKHFVTGLIYFIGTGVAVSMIPPLRNLALSMLASSGIVAIIVGLASQQALANIMSGVFLDLFRPFEVGDHVKIGKDITGFVEDITLRHTVIKTPENNYIMIPNTRVSGEIIENATRFDLKVRPTLDFYLSYSADLKQALSLARSVIESNHFMIDLRSSDQKRTGASPVDIAIIDMNPLGIHVRCAFWAANEEAADAAKFEAYKKIKESFDKNNIPFAQCPCATKPELG
jgi:small conductance mechanosensitive channel